MRWNKIENTDTGEPVENVFEVRLSMVSNRMPFCTAKVVIYEPVTDFLLTATYQTGSSGSRLVEDGGSVSPDQAAQEKLLKIPRSEI